VESPAEIQQVVVSFFRNHFSSEQWHWLRQNLDGIVFLELSDVKNQLLIRPF
jgi:hypothetical protein